MKYFFVIILQIEIFFQVLFSFLLKLEKIKGIYMSNKFKETKNNFKRIIKDRWLYIWNWWKIL